VALPSTINDREFGAFVESGTGIPAKRVVLYDASGNALLAPAALADGTANPTVGGLAAFNEVFNGSTWDRMSSATTDSVTGAPKVVILGADGNRMGSAQGMSDPATGARLLPVADCVTPDGANYTRIRTANVFKDITATAITAGTPLSIWTPAGGKKFRLMGWSISADAACSLIFKYGGTPTTMFRTEKLAANGISQSAPNLGNGSMPGAANDVLKLDVTANATVSGYVFGCEE
jgi:hypothetical protein